MIMVPVVTKSFGSSSPRALLVLVRPVFYTLLCFLPLLSWLTVAQFLPMSCLWTAPVAVTVNPGRIPCEMFSSWFPRFDLSQFLCQMPFLMRPLPFIWTWDRHLKYTGLLPLVAVLTTLLMVLSIALKRKLQTTLCCLEEVQKFTKFLCLILFYTSQNCAISCSSMCNSMFETAGVSLCWWSLSIILIVIISRRSLHSFDELGFLSLSLPVENISLSTAQHCHYVPLM